MAAKTFKGAKKPEAKKPSAKQVDAFVSGGSGTDRAADQVMRRLSVDIPDDLHTRFKVACAKGRTKMTRELVSFIEQKTRELENT